MTSYVARVERTLSSVTRPVSCTQPQPARRGPEAGRLERDAERGRHDHLAVGSLDCELAEAAVAHGEGQCVDRRLQRVEVLAPGEQRLAAALDVEHEGAVDEDDERAGLATG